MCIRDRVGSLNKISKAFSKFEQENERRPSPEELADELEIPVDKISDTLKVSDVYKRQVQCLSLLDR